MDFTELYAQKKMTADQAAALVKSGDWVSHSAALAESGICFLPFNTTSVSSSP